DQVLGAGDVGDGQVEGGGGPLGHLVAARLQDLDRRRQGHQRRAELVAHVRREASIAVHAELQGGGHVVESRRQFAQILVVGGLQAGVEPAAGDGLGGQGGGGGGPHRAARGPDAEGGARGRGGHGGAR